MPSFALLSLTERRALVAYVRTFRDEKAPPPSAPLALPNNPFASDPNAGVAYGKKTYHVVATCWACHPAYVTQREIRAYHEQAGASFSGGRPALYDSVAKDSSWGAPILPPDFLRDRVKTGIDVEGLGHVIGAGIGGTAMPTWAGGLNAKQLWGLAYYVRSLSLMRGTPEATALRSELLASAPDMEGAQ
jgi:mono/diheme cytochrome c family protein